ncbi:MAG TPA: hypothetical protein VFG51_01075 [Candidatus Saccharimonadia bacterium]|nr:hypothetical protein [Candidatus Saccharimonadia bacterium]
MILPQDVAPIKDLAQKAGSAYVLLGLNPSYDMVASALSLYLSLKSAGKEVQIACPDDMRVEFSHLVGVDEIKQSIGNRNLVVSFDYEENSVEKVSYNISDDGKKFNLVISPKSGVHPLDPSKLDYSYSGAEADVVFLFGATAFEDLAEMYDDNKSLFENANTISINAFQVQPFAKVNLDTNGQSCLAEGTLILLTELGLEPRDDIATNLLSSIEQATQRFQSLGVAAETFEAAAHLMKNGARRSATNPALNPNKTTTTPAFAQVLRQRSQGTVNMPPTPPMPAAPAQPEPVAVQAGEQQRIRQLKRTIHEQLKPTEAAPTEWTQPKVFTGSTQV